jgi:hypothetical protein
MTYQARIVRTATSRDGFFPHVFRWHERLIRVLSVRSVRTFGLERRYWVRTAEGDFELALAIDAGEWYVRHWPSWLGRMRARWHNTPRYPLPVRRRRDGAAQAPHRPAGTTVVRGGDHANGLALV